jgi:hypothetical protein
MAVLASASYRRRRQVGREHLPAVAVVAGHAVALADVEIGIGERSDRARVVEKRLLVLDRRLEPELVDDVVLRVAVVVDVDAIQDIVAELVEVRAAAGRFQRNPVGNQRHRARCVRADKRIDVGVVRQRIGGDEGRLAMARRHGEEDGPEDQAGRQCETKKSLTHAVGSFKRST